MRRRRGFTYIETVIAASMIIASLVVMTQLMMRPAEVVTTLSAKAVALQKTLYLAQDLVEQLRASPQPTSPLVNLISQAAQEPAYHLALIDDTVCVNCSTATPTQLTLNSCANIHGRVGAVVGSGSKLQTEGSLSSSVEFVTVQAIDSTGPPCRVTLEAGLTLDHALGTPVVPVASAAGNQFGIKETVVPNGCAGGAGDLIQLVRRPIDRLSTASMAGEKVLGADINVNTSLGLTSSALFQDVAAGATQIIVSTTPVVTPAASFVAIEGTPREAHTVREIIFRVDNTLLVSLVEPMEKANAAGTPVTFWQHQDPSMFPPPRLLNVARKSDREICVESNATYQTFYNNATWIPIPIPIFQQYLTALVTAPRLGTTLSTTVTASTNRIDVYDPGDIKTNTWLRIDGGANTEIRQVTGVSGNTITLATALTLVPHNQDAPVAVVTKMADPSTQTAGRRCILVGDADGDTIADTALFGVNEGVQVDLDVNMESGIVECVSVSGSPCICDLFNPPATDDRAIVLARPLRIDRSTRLDFIPLAPATASTAGLTVTGGGGQKYGF